MQAIPYLGINDLLLDKYKRIHLKKPYLPWKWKKFTGTNNLLFIFFISTSILFNSIMILFAATTPNYSFDSNN